MPRRTHGHSYGVDGRAKATPEYHSWVAMKSRCYNPTNNRFRLYGARGICVCEKLRISFEYFLLVLGLKPKPKREYSLDRRKNDGNYTCGRCADCRANGWKKNIRWATRSQQARNRRPFKQPLRRPEVSTDKIARAYLRLQSMPKVSVALRISVPTISRRLQKAGIAARPLGSNQFSQDSVSKPGPTRSTSRERHQLEKTA